MCLVWQSLYYWGMVETGPFFLLGDVQLIGVMYFTLIVSIRISIVEFDWFYY